MKIQWTLYLLFLLLPIASFAGSSVGNGGDAVVCRNTDLGIRSIELLDFYEARVERGQVLSLPSRTTLDETMKELLNRLTFHDTYFQEELTKAYGTFMSETLFLSGVELVDIPDSNHLSIPNGCKVEQVAVQRKPHLPGEKFYKINKDLWDHMDSANKAGLVLHELLFRNLTLYARDDYDSMFVRYLNSLTATDSLKTISYKDYLELISKKFFVPYTNRNGYLVPINTVAFRAEGMISGYSYKIFKDMTIDLAPGVSVQVRQGLIHFRNVGGPSYTVSFYPQTPTFILKSVAFTLGLGEVQEVTLEFNTTDQSLLRTRGTPVTFISPVPYDLSTEQMIPCSDIDFTDILPNQFTCLTPYRYNLRLFHEYDSIFKPITIREIIVDSTTMTLQNVFTENFNLDFYAGGGVSTIRCLAAGPSYSILVQAVPRPMKIIPKFYTLHFYQNNGLVQLNCLDAGDEIHFSPSGQLMGGYLPRFSLLYKAAYSFQPGGRSQIDCREGGIVNIEAPKYSAFANFQVKHLIFTGLADGEGDRNFMLEDAHGGSIRPILGDLLRFNELGQVEEIERNYCREAIESP